MDKLQVSLWLLPCEAGSMVSASDAVCPAISQAYVQGMMEEWGISNHATAESILRARQRQLRQRSSSKVRARLQVCLLKMSLPFSPFDARHS